ncbi:hypothetical protein L195_g018383 [Trifolium pratense]|uniref:Uncharacterized protein n=1 Tax=Trifolium pratense TaxID=57577 RepID=A0A2K3MWT9_TRIPR|nr:hypothetical protein L195_g018383 [Trifolium pratense]
MGVSSLSVAVSHSLVSDSPYFKTELSVISHSPYLIHEASVSPLSPSPYLIHGASKFFISRRRRIWFKTLHLSFTKLKLFIFQSRSVLHLSLFL